MKSKLLLLHGALGSTSQFEVLKEKLIPHFEVYAFNFSGHGSDTTNGDFSIERFANDTLDFLDQHHLNSINIFGYSMGGYVALKLAKENPEKIYKVMTLATKFDWNPESAALENKKLIPEIIEEKIPQFAEALTERHFPNDWKTIVRKTASMMTELGNGKAMKPEEFSSIGQQVLICVGEEDKMVSINESGAIANKLSHGKLKIIPGFKHPIESNDPEILADLIYSFLS